MSTCEEAQHHLLLGAQLTFYSHHLAALARLPSMTYILITWIHPESALVTYKTPQPIVIALYGPNVGCKAVQNT